jgi:membrane peptidoglycan carboxypeptidase
MAEAYATVTSVGIYCAPTAISRITDTADQPLPAPSAGCHRVLSSDVANAASYILRGVFTWPWATGAGLTAAVKGASKTLWLTSAACRDSGRMGPALELPDSKTSSIDSPPAATGADGH